MRPNVLAVLAGSAVTALRCTVAGRLAQPPRASIKPAKPSSAEWRSIAQTPGRRRCRAVCVSLPALLSIPFVAGINALACVMGAKDTQ